MRHYHWYYLSALLLSLAMVSPQGSAQPKAGIQKLVERGKYLVQFGGCSDCHSPKIMTPQGPVPDDTKLLSGSPSTTLVPEIPGNVLAPGKWGVLSSDDLTIWAGPWGVSFTANLTPDPNNGLGKWTEAMFIKALRTGKHMGEGRMILPPMPWQGVGSLTDADLKAVFAYLHSLKPIDNTVHDPIPPAGQ
jgi:mono/diheme cytochrome c family protein